MRPDAVLATNTSSLSVDALAEGLAHPERCCGFHFFNPVHRMPLVEVVRGARTSDATLVDRGGARAAARQDAGRGRGRAGLRGQPHPHALPARGDAPARGGLSRSRDIDAAMRRFGMPMGPFEVLDEVGLDVAQQGGRRAEPRVPRAHDRRRRRSRSWSRPAGSGEERARASTATAAGSASPIPQLRGLLGLHAPAPRAEPRRARRAHGAGDDQRGGALPRGGRGRGRRACSTSR